MEGVGEERKEEEFAAKKIGICSCRANPIEPRLHCGRLSCFPFGFTPPTLSTSTSSITLFSSRIYPLTLALILLTVDHAAIRGVTCSFLFFSLIERCHRRTIHLSPTHSPRIPDTYHQNHQPCLTRHGVGSLLSRPQGQGMSLYPELASQFGSISV